MNKPRETFQYLPLNKPLPRAGIYLIKELSGLKTYVGISCNVLVRSKQHLNTKDSTKLANAIKKHGANNFLFSPIFYCLPNITDFSFLSQLEAELIASYDSINSGYNIIAATGRVGPYGKEFAKLISESHSKRTPEERSAIALRGKATIGKDRLSSIAKDRASKLGREFYVNHMKIIRSSQSQERRTEISKMAGAASALATPIEKKRLTQAKAVASHMANTTKEQRSHQFKFSGLSNLKTEQLSKNGSKGAAKANSLRTADQRRALASKAATALHASRTQEERIIIAKKAGAAGGAAHAAKSIEEKSLIAKKAWKTRKETGKTSTPTKGSVWINNGIIRRRLTDISMLPVGWSIGWHLN